MAVTRCGSSHLMTGLLAWRNPHENELERTGKIIATEIGLGLLILTSVIETVAYSALAIASLTLYPFTDKPCVFFAELLQSSAFTIIWAVTDAILYNPFSPRVETLERDARAWAGMLISVPVVMLWLGLTYWQQQHEPENGEVFTPIPDGLRVFPEQINQGANFLQQDVLAGASPETVAFFRDLDPDIYMFILTKAVYIYTFGAKKNDPMPNFFKPETKISILALRRGNHREATVRELHRLMENPTAFATAPQGEAAQSLFNGLRGAGSKELREGVFITRCWAKAVQQLQRNG